MVEEGAGGREVEREGGREGGKASMQFERVDEERSLEM